jgi:hypothetical protein
MSAPSVTSASMRDLVGARYLALAALAAAVAALALAVPAAIVANPL